MFNKNQEASNTGKAVDAIPLRGIVAQWEQDMLDGQSDETYKITIDAKGNWTQHFMPEIL